MAGGLLAGKNAALLAMNKKTITFPEEMMIGALSHFISNLNSNKSSATKRDFQPMPPNFGLLPELKTRINNKKNRYQAYRDRALQVLDKTLKENPNFSTHIKISPRTISC